MNDLIKFVKTRRAEGEFGRFVGLVGEEVGFVVAIGILSWLKRQKRNRHEKELELNPDHVWCQQLRLLLEMDFSLARLFEIEGGRLRFKAEIDVSERQMVRDLADAEYRPIIKKRSAESVPGKTK